MSASTSCTGTLISPPDIHPSLLHPGNLVPKDLFSITSTWKLNTEGFTHPRTCTRGRFCFISPLRFKWSFFNPQARVLVIYKAPSPRGNLRQEGCHFSQPVLQNVRHTKKQNGTEERAFVARFHCQMSAEKDKKKTKHEHTLRHKTHL